MSGGSGANNSWTILTSEESAAETLRPVAEGPRRHGGGLTSAAGSGADPPTETPPVEGPGVSEEQTAPLSGDTGAVPGGDALSQSEGLPEGPSQSGPDPDSFSDSCAHVGASPDEPPASLPSAETLGGGEFMQEEERLTEEGAAPHLPTGEEVQQEGTASGPSQSISGKLAASGSSVDSKAGEETTGEGGEPEVRRRSLLAALEHIGRTEEEEDAEEEFQLPRPEGGSGFSLNKCILGAVILLGLGTIFFSGFLMDLDEDSDYGTRELKDSEVPGKREWPNPEVPPVPADADSTEMLNKISVLQAQVQAQKEELKVAKGQAAEGAKQRLRWEEVEKENSRLKTEMASFPVLQKENERMKRELESVPALQKELDTLRSTVTELKVSSATSDASVKPTTSPPSGQAEDSRQAHAGTADKHAKKEKERKKDKYEAGEKRSWKEREMSEWREGEKKDRKDVGKSGKHEHGKVDKRKDKEGTEKKQEKEMKKEKAVRGDEGKTWKARDGKKEWMERSERKEEKEWKKTKHDKVGEGKQWRDKEKKDWKRGDDHGERHRGREDWRGENERKKVKGEKEKWERKEWKEKKEWKSKDWEEGRARGERKQWEQSENHGKRHGKGRKEESKEWDEHEWKGKNTKDDKEWKRKDGSKRWDKKGEWANERKGDRPSSRQHKEALTSSHHRHEERVWGDRKPPHTHRRPSPEQPDYWAQQRARLQRRPKPQRCSSPEACARAEGLLPVPLAQFQALLQRYLSKAEEAGTEASVAEQLRELTGEFFPGGLFAHDQMSFQDFVEDVSDILEHLVERGEGEEEEEEEEDSAIEEEMEEFEREVLQKFSAGEEEDGVGAGEEGRKERGRGRG